MTAAILAVGLPLRQPVSQPYRVRQHGAAPTLTDAEKRVMASATSGFLARTFGTAKYEEIDSRLAAVLNGDAAPPPALLDWARDVVAAERGRR